MAGEEDFKEDVSDDNDEEESLRNRQKQELKELRGKIQALKRSVPKGDKKKKKEVTAQITQLELEIKQKHEAELDELLKQRPGHNLDDLVHDWMLHDQTLCGREEEASSSKKNPSKAQRKKERREQKRREFDEKIAREPTSDEPSAASIEKEQLVKQLNLVGLQIKEINPDGHCMFAAVSDQLLLRDGIKVEVEQLRVQCADYIEQHQKDLLPFLVDPETGETFSDEKLVKYLCDLKYTAMWGGQLELRALSHVHQIPINVHQANCSVLTIGDEYRESIPINIIYHKHLYGLGEHYNSVVPTTV